MSGTAPSKHTPPHTPQNYVYEEWPHGSTRDVPRMEHLIVFDFATTIGKSYMVKGSMVCFMRWKRRILALVVCVFGMYCRPLGRPLLHTTLLDQVGVFVFVFALSNSRCLSCSKQNVTIFFFIEQSDLLHRAVCLGPVVIGNHVWPVTVDIYCLIMQG